MEMPPLVRRALALAEEQGFEKSCRLEEGALLHVLAARRGIARAAEIGTGAGVGAAWIVSALPPQTPFFTVELDPPDAQGVPVWYGSVDVVVHDERGLRFVKEADD